jgi:hypothetical protein
MMTGDGALTATAEATWEAPVFYVVVNPNPVTNICTLG